MSAVKNSDGKFPRRKSCCRRASPCVFCFFFPLEKERRESALYVFSFVDLPTAEMSGRGTRESARLSFAPETNQTPPHSG